jgi:3-dehydroquinate synthase
MRKTYSTTAGTTQVIVECEGLGSTGRYLTAIDAMPKPDRAVLVTDETVGPLYGATLSDSLAKVGIEVHDYRIPPGEASKSLQALGQLYTFFAQCRLARDGLVIALGGGVVSDLAGLAAATWMRGVPFAILPTTLEAQIDAAIGGKTAVNIPEGKNLVGVFYQPALVLIDPSCLETLDPRDVRAGLAESVKHAVITSADFLSWHETNAEAMVALHRPTITELVERNVGIKIGIVQRDPLERTGERMTLNFGHTIGHAIEACCGYSLRHGECVALGMLAVCRLSRLMGLLSDSAVDRVEALLERLDLPTRWATTVPFDRIMEVIVQDKKSRGSRVQWVLLEDFGRTRITSDVDETLIREAYQSIVETPRP